MAPRDRRRGRRARSGSVPAVVARLDRAQPSSELSSSTAPKAAHERVELDIAGAVPSDVSPPSPAARVDPRQADGLIGLARAQSAPPGLRHVSDTIRLETTDLQAFPGNQTEGTRTARVRDVSEKCLRRHGCVRLTRGAYSGLLRLRLELVADAEARLDEGVARTPGGRSSGAGGGRRRRPCGRGASRAGPRPSGAARRASRRARGRARACRAAGTRSASARRSRRRRRPAPRAGSMRSSSISIGSPRRVSSRRTPRLAAAATRATSSRIENGFTR